MGRKAFERQRREDKMECRDTWKNAIKCENIFSRYSHIRWLIRLQIRYSQSKMAPDKRIDDALAQLVTAELIFRRGAPPDAELSGCH